MKIKNRKKLLEQLTKIIMDFEKAMNKFETDIYCEIDKDGNVTLHQYTNVDGDILPDENLYLLYADEEHEDELFDNYKDIAEIADALKINEAQLIKLTASYNDKNVDDVDFDDVVAYVQSQDTLYEKCKQDYYDWIDAQKSMYAELADEQITEVEEEYNFDHED